MHAVQSVTVRPSARRERARLIDVMRAQGKTRVQIAADFQERYNINARVAMRWAHGWSQADVAREWSLTWDDPKTGRNISAWERWPQGGHAPTLSTLDRLARLYKCNVADLLGDLQGYRHLDDMPDAAAGLLQATPNLSGVWHSRYRYPSGDEERESEHYVVIRQDAQDVVAHSLPHSNGSRLRLELVFNPPTATGKWTEWTSPTGRYRGASYHGSIQLLVDPSGRTMTGRWVGFGRSFAVNTGDWRLTWIDGVTTEPALREYHLKV